MAACARASRSSAPRSAAPLPGNAGGAAERGRGRGRSRRRSRAAATLRRRRRLLERLFSGVRGVVGRFLRCPRRGSPGLPRRRPTLPSAASPTASAASPAASAVGFCRIASRVRGRPSAASAASPVAPRSRRRPCCLPRDPHATATVQRADRAEPEHGMLHPLDPPPWPRSESRRSRRSPPRRGAECAPGGGPRHASPVGGGPARSPETSMP